MAKLFKVTAKYTAATVAMQNVLYFESTLTAQQLCEDLVASGKFFAYLKKVQTSTTVYSSIAALEIGHLILDPDYYELAYTAVGEGGGPNTDPQLAACVSLHTGLSGRRRRGRFFIGGIADEAVENGKLTSAMQGSIAGYLNSIFALYVTGSPSTKWVVFSRTIFSGLTDIILDSYKPVTSFAVRAVMSTMRSRLPS